MSNGNSLSQVKAGLVSILKTLKPVNGYAVTLPDANIHLRYTTALANMQLDSAFPKCFVIIDSGLNVLQTTGFQGRELMFTVIIVVKKTITSGNVEAQVQIERFIEAMQDLFVRNDTLGGVVQDAQLVEFYTDGGSADPEGIAAFSIKTQQDYRAGA